MNTATKMVKSSSYLATRFALICVFAAAILLMTACKKDEETAKPVYTGQVSAKKNGVVWDANVRFAPSPEDNSLVDFIVHQIDKNGVVVEYLFFNKVQLLNQNEGALRRRSAKIVDTLATEYRSRFDGDNFSAFYSVRVEGSPANWLRIDSYDPNTGAIQATFQGTYVMCASDVATADYIPIPDGDSLVFTEGKITGTIPR